VGEKFVFLLLFLYLCIKSVMSKKLTKEDIVERARAIHGDKYDYSLFLDDNFTFNGVREDMPIICPKHGVFNISISSHINGGRGCRKCANDRIPWLL
jgi:hypothetical protein